MLRKRGKWCRLAFEEGVSELVRRVLSKVGRIFFVHLPTRSACRSINPRQSTKKKFGDDRNPVADSPMLSPGCRGRRSSALVVSASSPSGLGSAACSAAGVVAGAGKGGSATEGMSCNISSSGKETCTKSVGSVECLDIIRRTANELGVAPDNYRRDAEDESGAVSGERRFGAGDLQPGRADSLHALALFRLIGRWRPASRESGDTADARISVFRPCAPSATFLSTSPTH